MSDLGTTLAKPLGPLPIGGWALIGGGGLGLFFLLQNRSAKVPVQVEDGSVPPGVATGATGGWTYNPPSTSETTGDTLPQDNQGWATHALQQLLKTGGYDAYAASVALNKYIAGSPIDPSETAYIRAAITAAGPAPQYVPPPMPAQTNVGTTSSEAPDYTSIISGILAAIPQPAVPVVNVQLPESYSAPVYSAPAPSTPAPAPTPAAPAHSSTPKIYTTKRGDTGADVAVAVYGSNPGWWTTIYNANRSKYGNKISADRTVHMGGGLILTIPARPS